MLDIQADYSISPDDILQTYISGLTNLDDKDKKIDEKIFLLDLEINANGTSLSRNKVVIPANSPLFNIALIPRRTLINRIKYLNSISYGLSSPKLTITTKEPRVN